MNRLDLGINYGAVSTVVFNTSILENGNGLEQRNPKWKYPLHTFEIGDRTIDKTTFDYLTEFFMSIRGKSRLFLWKDWQDYKAINQQIGVGNGTLTQFQLTKSYGDSNPLVVPITKPVTGTLSIRVSGIINTAWTLNTDTGIVSFSTAPTGIITATFEFNYLVRSSVDSLNNRFKAIRLSDGKTAFQIGSISLKEQRE